MKQQDTFQCASVRNMVFAHSHTRCQLQCASAPPPFRVGALGTRDRAVASLCKGPRGLGVPFEGPLSSWTSRRSPLTSRSGRVRPGGARRCGHPRITGSPTRSSGGWTEQVAGRVAQATLSPLNRRIGPRSNTEGSRHHDHATAARPASAPAVASRYPTSFLTCLSHRPVRQRITSLLSQRLPLPAPPPGDHTGPTPDD